MSYCLNPRCRTPQNPAGEAFCIYCGSPLLLGNRYRALKRISAGGIGRTFLGIDEGVAKKPFCAVKQIDLSLHSRQSDEQASRTFLKEATKLRELGQHPQIPKLLAYFAPEGMPESMPILVQEWIDGRTLAEGGLYGESELYEFLHQILPVLQFVSDRGVIHRDINPNNLIYPRKKNPDAPLFLVDFSTAKVTAKTTLARTGSVIGSAAYAAPEQLRLRPTFASDIYSLGVTCIYLLTQIHPFELYSSMDGIRVWSDFLAQPVSDRLREIINKMTADAVGSRYQCAADVYRDLHAGAALTLPELPEGSHSKLSPLPQWQCICTLKGHLSSVNALAFRPTGPQLASASADRTIALWDIEGEKRLDTLTEHRSVVSAIAYTPDGELLASGSWDYTLRLWQGDIEIKELNAHSGWVQALAMSPDGKILASGSADKTIKIWDVASGEAISTLTGHGGAICSLAIGTPNSWNLSQETAGLNGTLASGSTDNTIKIWDLAAAKEQKTLHEHEDDVMALVYTPSGQLLISGSRDRTIKIWNLKQSSVTHTLEGHTDAVTSLAVNRTGSLLVSGSSDKTVKLWHPASGRLLQTLSEHDAGVLAVAISPDSRIIASGSQDRTIKLWRFG
ncbi:MAG: serine/threonine-protein kinase [Cyanobacteriota bacterium]|nr:serine/threonine-protein kinase [Cyanobacteriota bacterium]